MSADEQLEVVLVRRQQLMAAIYELLGPKVNRNPEGAPIHMLVSHGAQWGGDMSDAPREFHALREWLAQRDIEGVVWRHPDGRMVKIKKSDFGMPRKPVAP